MTLAMEATGLRTCFGRTLALDGMDLSVAPGVVHGFLGTGGAGKTTTLRILRFRGGLDHRPRQTRAGEGAEGQGWIFRCSPSISTKVAMRLARVSGLFAAAIR